MSGQDIQRVVVAVRGVDRANRRIRFVASDETVDRYNEVILADGWRLENFKANPVFLAGHQMVTPDGRPTIIGRFAEIGVSGKELIGQVEFASTDLAEEWWALYRDGFARAVSVGFLPLAHEWREVGGRSVLHFTESDLAEVSAVAVGANPNALLRSGGAKTYVRSALQEIRDLLAGDGGGLVDRDVLETVKGLEKCVQNFQDATLRFAPWLADDPRQLAGFEHLADDAKRYLAEVGGPFLVDVFRLGIEALCERTVNSRREAEEDALYDDLADNWPSGRENALDGVLGRLDDLCKGLESPST